MKFKYVVKNVTWAGGKSATFMPDGPLLPTSGPGYEAPVNLVYSARNSSACVRIPIAGSSPKAKRIEFRIPDPSANPYLAFAAQLMAGLHGIKNRTEPPAPPRARDVLRPLRLTGP